MHDSDQLLFVPMTAELDTTRLCVSSSLLSTHLHSVPKYDKTQFISAFIHSQKPFVKHYADEGRSLMASLDLASSNEQHSVYESLRLEKLRSTLTSEYGFNTPVLKPRTRRVKPSSESAQNLSPKECVQLNPDDKIKPNKRSTEKRGRMETDSVTELTKSQNVIDIQGEMKPFNAGHPKACPSKQKTVKDAINLVPEDEIATSRLEERRARKRVKRDIMKPDIQGNSAGKTVRSIDKDKLEGKKTKAKRLPSGFALMHGFSATNIGKDRLTINPTQHWKMGVFNNGRASTKTNILKEQRKGNKEARFSEERFLGKKPKPYMALECQTSYSSMKHDGVFLKNAKKCFDLNITGSKKAKQARETPNEDFIRNYVSGLSSGAWVSGTCSEHCPGSISKGDATAAESIVWDIERASSIIDSEDTTPGVLEDVVIPTCNLPWSKTGTRSVVEIETHKNTQSKYLSLGDVTRIVGHVKMTHESCSSTDSSVGPFESASQCQVIADTRKRDSMLVATFSKYFQTTNSNTDRVQLLEQDSIPVQDMLEDLLPAAHFVDRIAVNVQQTSELLGDTKIEEPLFPAINLPSCVTNRTHSVLREHEHEPDRWEHEEFTYEYLPSTQDTASDMGLEPLGCITWNDRPTLSLYDYLVANDTVDGLDFLEPVYEGLVTEHQSGQVSVWDPEAHDYDDLKDLHRSEFYDNLEHLDQAFSAQDGSLADYVSEYMSDISNGCTTSRDESDISDSVSQYGSAQFCFLEGKALLLGCTSNEANVRRKTHIVDGVLHAEVDVAKTLKHHWLPQRL